MDGRIVLIPIGPIPAGLLRILAARLRQGVGVQVFIGDEIALPTKGYNLGRRQHEGRQIIAALRQLSHPHASRLIGLIDADCYTEGLTFIFGQAVMNGPVAFVALPRLRETFYQRPENADLFHDRVLKEIVHELGHTWDLPHCPDRHCVMHFSNSLEDTDIKSVAFCDQCGPGARHTHPRRP